MQVLETMPVIAVLASNRLVPKFLSCYARTAHPPLLFTLGSGTRRNDHADNIGLSSDKVTVHRVDTSEPDIDAISSAFLSRLETLENGPVRGS